MAWLMTKYTMSNTERQTRSVWNGDLIFGLRIKCTHLKCLWWLSLVTFVPKKDDDGDGVGRKPEYGDGGEKNALEDKLEIESITVNDVNIFTQGIVGGSIITHFSIMDTGLHPKPRFSDYSSNALQGPLYVLMFRKTSE